MQKMDLFCSSNYVISEIGVRLCKLLNIACRDQTEQKQLGTDFCNLINTEPRYVLAVIGSGRLPVEYVKAIIKITRHFSYISNIIALRDSQGYEICIRIFTNVSSELARNAHECYTIIDFAAYSNCFIQLTRIEKVDASYSLDSVRKILDNLGATRPIIFEAGYLYESQYDEMYAEDKWLDLPEKLCRIYEDKLHAININHVVGNNEESIAMLFVSQEYDADWLLQYFGS